jgi:hypothetical protein
MILLTYLSTLFLILSLTPLYPLCVSSPFYSYSFVEHVIQSLTALVFDHWSKRAENPNVPRRRTECIRTGQISFLVPSVSSLP